MKIQGRKIQNVAELLEAIQTAFDHPNLRANWFRGFTRVEWKLVSSVLKLLRQNHVRLEFGHQRHVTIFT